MTITKYVAQYRHEDVPQWTDTREFMNYEEAVAHVKEWAPLTDREFRHRVVRRTVSETPMYRIIGGRR